MPIPKGTKLIYNILNIFAFECDNQAYLNGKVEKTQSNKKEVDASPIIFCAYWMESSGV
jgi:hypothetical protein